MERTLPIILLATVFRRNGRGEEKVAPELEAVRRATQNATRSASAEALARAPEGKWSSLQVLEHLFLSYTATTKGLLQSLEAGRPEPGGQSFAQRLRGVYVLGIGRFPAGVEAPKQTVPRNILGDDAIRQFNDALVAMDATLTDTERRFGQNARVLRHPVLGPLTAQQWRRFHLVHGRHHLRQIAVRLNSQS